MGTSASRRRLGVAVTGVAVLGVAVATSVHGRRRHPTGATRAEARPLDGAGGHEPPSPRRRGRVVGVALAALVVLGGLAMLPAFAFEGRGSVDRAVEAGAGDALSRPSIAPVTVGGAVPAAAVVGGPSPLAQQERAIAAFTPEQQVEFALLLMTEEERQAFYSLLTTTTTVPPTLPPTTRPPAAVVPAPAAPVGGGAPAPAVPLGVWDDLAYCEASGNWAINTGNGYYGGLQFAHSTWVSYGGQAYAPYAHQATREQQIAVAERILASHGGTFRAWPGCRRKLGLP